MDDEVHPLENITDLNQCLDVEPTEENRTCNKDKLLENSNH